MWFFFFFFFNDTATTEIYTLSLHDALPICLPAPSGAALGPEGFEPPLPGLKGRCAAVTPRPRRAVRPGLAFDPWHEDRKSTRLNSSHANISYAVFCLKKKKKNTNLATTLYY